MAPVLLNPVRFYCNLVSIQKRVQGGMTRKGEMTQDVKFAEE